MTPADVAVAPAAALAARPRLFAALEALLPVRFVAAGEDAASGARAVLVFAEADAPAPDAPALPTLVFTATPDDAAPSPRPVTLADAGGVDRRLRGATLFDRLGAPLAVRPGDAVLAADGDGAAAWVRGGGADRVASTLPELPADGILYALLSERAIAMVALLQLLREAAGPAGWTPAPLRACIVFDDPNLRRPTYGHVDYAALLRHADEHGYHAAMATIPIDATRAHPAAVRLFAERPDRLSLNVHGNDHYGSELLDAGEERAALALAAQALRRVEAFERRTGLAVDRVMMPPHGRCSQAMSAALGAVGFDALSAIHPLPWTRDWRTGPVLTGLRPADVVAGCPVIPRMALTSSPADIGLRAFLEHPVILYGHHQDVAGGLDLLAEAARVVNGLGDVAWVSAGAIARGNAQTRFEAGGLLRVRAYARRLELARPAGIASVTVEAPEDAVRADALTGFSLDGGAVLPFGTPAPLDAAAGPLALRLHGAGDVEAAAVPAPAWRPWPKLRRLATEARDRSAALR